MPDKRTVLMGGDATNSGLFVVDKEAALSAGSLYVAKGTLHPPIKANYEDKFGAAVGYLTAQASSVKLGKG
ncbi:MAG: hypothetical protein RLZ81_2731 [Pseudomonadota bacterium]|jgi:hypothetical protein